MRQNTLGNIIFYDLIIACRQLTLLYENTNLDWHSPFVQGLLVLLKEKTAKVPIRIPPEDEEEGGKGS